jgi:hypothetical protein
VGHDRVEPGLPGRDAHHPAKGYVLSLAALCGAAPDRDSTACKGVAFDNTSGRSCISNGIKAIEKDARSLIQGGMMEKIARYIYLVAAWLFVIGVAVQVFLAGMVVVAVRMGWNNHISFGHMLAAPLLVMLVSLYAGRMPGRMKRLNWLLFLVYALQADVIIFLRFQVPVVSAFHPVLALVDFALGLALARAAWPLAREVHAPSRVPPELETSTNIK